MELIQIASINRISDPSLGSPTPSRRDLIQQLKDATWEDQPEMPLEHKFSPGIYIREVLMYSGHWIVGHKHKTKHFNIVLSGSADVEIDGVTTRITAPFVFESEAGAQKFLLIHEDMRWITVHANPDNETDIVKLEDRIFDLSDPMWSGHEGMTLNEFRMKATREKNQICQDSQ